MLAETDLAGGLDNFDPPLVPFQRGAIVEVIRKVFCDYGFEIPQMGCALPVPRPKAQEPQPTQHTAPSEQTAVADPAGDQVIALSDVIDQSLRGTAKFMGFSELALCRKRYFEAAGNHPAEEHTPSAE